MKKETVQSNVLSGGDRRCFIFDINRCTGCGACVTACIIRGGDLEAGAKRAVCVFNEPRHPRAPLFFLSLACNHCEDPACARFCPALAYDQDPVTGVVRVNGDKCMGCKYCTWACPYDAPRYNVALGYVQKCDFCEDRLENGEAPACVRACPVEALRSDSLSRAEADPALMPAPAAPPGFTQASLSPAIRFVRPHRTTDSVPRTPAVTAPPDPIFLETLFPSCLTPPPRKITLKSEWALLLFTTIASLLAAFYLAFMNTSGGLFPLLFLGSGAAAMLLSAAHLGRKTRAFRAVFNVRRSWLSREIFFFSLFLFLAGLSMLFFPDIRLLSVSAAVAALLALFSIDRIYQTALKVTPLNFHSAHTLLNALYLAGILSGRAALFLPAGVLKLALYGYRKLHFFRVRRPVRRLLSIARVLTGFLLPLAYWVVWGSGAAVLWVALSVVVGDWLDRLEFYDELEIVTPESQIRLDLYALLEKEA